MGCDMTFNGHSIRFTSPGIWCRATCGLTAHWLLPKPLPALIAVPDQLQARHRHNAVPADRAIKRAPLIQGSLSTSWHH